MGRWSFDLINGDSMLEFAMDLLTAAGIGPKDYEQRKTTISFGVVPALSNMQGGLGLICRHSQEEYEEYFACLDAARHKSAELQKGLGKMLALANAAQLWCVQNSVCLSVCLSVTCQWLEESADPCRGSNVAGRGFDILAIILMSAGC
tara:strand:+ start:2727 stop:3170 length:444 start_codon:yes stop_codon:yes gene_type:complete